MKTILVVDDDPATRLILRTIIEDIGHSSFEAADGRQALDALDAVVFDIAFIDLSLPEFDGIELIRAIKTMAPETRIVAISGFLGGQLLKPASLLGADLTLLKPLHEEVVVEAIRSLLAE